MSEWTSELSNLPSRCQHLLNKYFIDEQHGLNRYKPYEVTLLLCLAAQALVVPLERLKRNEANTDSMEWWNSIQNTPIYSLTDDLFKDCKCDQWYSGIVGTTEDDEQLKGTKIIWSQRIMKQQLSQSGNSNVNQVLSRMRNAISHANVSSLEDPITKLMFISAKPADCLGCRRKGRIPDPIKVEWQGLVAPIMGVKQLIENWCAELERLGASFDETPRSRSYEFEEVGV